MHIIDAQYLSRKLITEQALRSHCVPHLAQFSQQLQPLILSPPPGPELRRGELEKLRYYKPCMQLVSAEKSERAPSVRTFSDPPVLSGSWGRGRNVVGRRTFLYKLTYAKRQRDIQKNHGPGSCQTWVQISSPLLTSGHLHKSQPL